MFKVIVSIYILFLNGCSVSKPSFYHRRHGKVSVSSPIVDKELRSCSDRLKTKRYKPKRVSSGSIAVASVPLIFREDIGKGIGDSVNILKTISHTKVIKQTTLNARTDMLNCMRDKGWSPVEE